MIISVRGRSILEKYKSRGIQIPALLTLLEFLGSYDHVKGLCRVQFVKYSSDPSAKKRLLPGKLILHEFGACG